MNLENSQYIRSIELKRNNISEFSKYQFCLPIVKAIGYKNEIKNSYKENDIEDSKVHYDKF